MFKEKLLSYKMHPKQLENVFSLSSKERYEHFVSKVADWEEVWILIGADNNFLTVNSDANDIEYLPVWPHPDYAKAYAEGLDLSLEPKLIELTIFMERWLLGLQKDGLKVGTLPNLEVTVWIMEPSDLLTDLENEVSQYE